MPESVRANMAYDLVADLRRIERPTLVIELCTPEEDERYGRQGPELMRLLPGGALATLENGGLDAMARECERLAPIVVRYLAT